MRPDPTDRSGDPSPADRPGAPRQHEDETEPDARFTYANERTFLAWNRTALALIVAGLAITQLLPPFPGVPWGRHLLAVPLIVLGAVLSVASYLEWTRNQRAMRRGQPLPRSALPRILTGCIAAVAIAAAVLVLVAPGSGR
jgi:putative membrane protein